MKKILLLSAICATIFATSCKKDSEATPSKNNVKVMDDKIKPINGGDYGKYD
ncbi:hypothetical protein [Pelobium manganitolerans]|uniref:hypothetical protein n=1 Tax=Pelobium manganitolerans TaxID=1842495 RepID=UPI0016014BF4|nr:hypothetical protein [Pelobium manganitolerans]